MSATLSIVSPINLDVSIFASCVIIRKRGCGSWLGYSFALVSFSSNRSGYLSFFFRSLPSATVWGSLRSICNARCVTACPDKIT